MKYIQHFFVSCIFLLAASGTALADEAFPWGSAKSLDIDYPPHKVIYDLTTGDPKQLDFTLNRISYLNTLYKSDPFDSSIIIVVHEDALPFFAIKNFDANKKLMERAANLTVGTTIEFRMCKVSAKFKGFEPKDIHGFIQMVPMADAEMIRLQVEEGYAYLH